MMLADRSVDSDDEGMVDLASRLESIASSYTTDVELSQMDAVESANAGGDIDYAILVKQYRGDTGQKGH